MGLVYNQATNQTPYTGFALEWRSGVMERSGVTVRNVEHDERVVRTHRPGAKALRYRYWRRGQRGTHGMLVVRREWRKTAAVMETQAINGLDVFGNSKKKRRSLGGNSGQPGRGPPHGSQGQDGRIATGPGRR